MLAHPAGAPAARRHGRAPLRTPPALLALLLWLVWTGATYLLEGRILTLLRPEAAGARILYVVVANLAIGIVGAGLVLRRLIAAGVVTTRQVGFPPVSRSAVAVLAGGVLGFGAYIAQGPPTLDAVVLLNGLAQVLVASIPEVLVCWAVLGATLEASLAPHTGRWGTVLAGLASAVLFGLYHYAHSPPFNTPGMVAVLSIVGVVTGVFFFLTRDVYGTIAFHNFLAAFGVLHALDRAGGLDAFTVPRPSLIGSAVVALAALIAVHVLLLRPRTTGAAARAPGSRALTDCS